ncbi:hypothetical protein D915_005469 [Fasciola hepatica]|uniref:Peptidase A2 domain-containing protein n=1 Tax=Fasciola hepatica TaxID=6192 RepID=A0A4E0RC40_FASHE|nr:hypothetical protein D915_005469 [Fasciola hepatica]
MSSPFVSLNNIDWQSALVVEGLLNGRWAKLLIDTGASCSVINPSLTKISHSVPLNGKLIAANGTVIPILGQVAGSVSIGRCIVPHQFLCADVAWDAILGMDFLRGHRIVIDSDRQLLVANERPEPIGQPVAALKLDNSWINEMLLGACVDRETNSEHLEMAKKRQKSSYDAIAHGPTYRLGDYVLLHRPRPPPDQTAAFPNPWKGPYVILCSMSPQTYTIRLIQNLGSEVLTFHYNQLKSANEANPTNNCILPVTQELCR